MQKFIFHPLKVHRLLLIVSDLPRHVVRLVFNVRACVGSLLLYKIVLLSQAVDLLLADLLLAELRLVVVLFTHTVHVVFHCLLSPANLLNCLHLLFPKVLVSEEKLLLLLVLALLHDLAIFLGFRQAHLIFSLLQQHLIVVLVLQVLQLTCLLAGLFDLLNSSQFFILEHPDTVP